MLGLGGMGRLGDGAAHSQITVRYEDGVRLSMDLLDGQVATPLDSATALADLADFQLCTSPRGDSERDWELKDPYLLPLLPEPPKLPDAELAP